MMDVMKAAFDEALKRQKDKRVKLEITFGGEQEEEKEDPAKKSPDLAPEVKDAKGPEDEKPEAEIEVESEDEPKDEAASVLEQMPESVGREPASFDEKAAAQFKKKLAEKKK